MRNQGRLLGGTSDAPVVQDIDVVELAEAQSQVARERPFAEASVGQVTRCPSDSLIGHNGNQGRVDGNEHAVAWPVYGLRREGGRNEPEGGVGKEVVVDDLNHWNLSKDPALATDLVLFCIRRGRGFTTYQAQQFEVRRSQEWESPWA